jgi:hypothetical protein
MSQEPGVPAIRPFQPAPVSGYYQLLNVFGRPSGEETFLERGFLAPSAPIEHTWRLKPPTERDWGLRGRR